MKKLMVLAIVAALVLGIVDGDCTAAVVMGMLFLPQVFERGGKKNGKGKRNGRESRSVKPTIL